MTDDMTALRSLAEKAREYAEHHGIKTWTEHIFAALKYADAVSDRLDEMHIKNLALQRQAATAEHDRQLAWRDKEASRTAEVAAIQRAEHAEDAIERVRALHQPTGGIKIPRTLNGVPVDSCRACLTVYPCATIVTLTGEA